jgi:hypothetical protein
MKKWYFLSCLLSFGNMLSAQNLTRSDIYYRVGENYTMFFSDSVSYGTSGIGVTWDLSAMNNNYQQAITVGAFSDASYPNGDLYVDLGYETRIYKTTDTLIEEVGVIGLSNGYSSISDPMIFMKFPITPAYSYSDTFVFSYTSNGHSMTGVESLQNEFSGYGTLITPFGTFTDVVRIKSSSTVTNTDNVNGNTYHQTETTYNWYKTGVHHELAMITEGNNDSQPFYGVYYFDVPADLGLDENTSSHFSLSPNPSSDLVTIKSDELMTNIEVYTVSGELVLNSKLNETNSTAINISTLKSGVYLLKVYEMDGSVSVQRITKN